MVSKVAVMALVAVVAVPILLGFGLNIETVDEQVWAGNNDPINLSDYLMNSFDSSAATFTDADIYKMNSNIFYRYFAVVDGQSTNVYFYPEYQRITSTSTTLPMDSSTVSGSFTMNNDDYLQIIVDGGYDATNYYTLNDGVNHVKSVVLKNGSGVVNYIGPGGQITYSAGSGLTSVTLTAHGDISARILNDDGSGDHYADITGGFRLNMDGPVWASSVDSLSGVQYTYTELSQTTKSMLISMDLNTITESDARFRIGTSAGAIQLRKTITDDVVKWEYTTQMSAPFTWNDLYYNPLTSSNTYQLYINNDHSGELRYIGAWKDSIGPADALLTYDLGFTNTSNQEYISSMVINGQSPVMRIDAARVGAYDFRVMEDAVYDPAVFKLNPATTLSNGVKYGSSIEFGGNTYTVSNGNITLGTHEVSLNGMVFDSVQASGQYQNRINGDVVSVTAEPSTITFNGKWHIDVSTVSQSTDTVSETKWIPGHFAWNGLDDDFLMAGLLTCVGVFIALGIYGRRSGAKVLPLLLVCGGAAFMFLLML